MDFTSYRRTVRKAIAEEPLSELYPHDVSMYRESPKSEISILEFEQIALDRLKLLRIIEQAAPKGNRLYSDQWKTCIKDDLAKAGLKKYVRLMGGTSGTSDLDYQARKADYLSHFILRLAYCRSEQLRRWFLSRELEWFWIRFTAQSREGVKNFLRLYKFSYTPISEEEKVSLRHELEASTAGLILFEETEFFKVPFTEVCSLVRGRKVFLKAGFAYIPSSELVVCIQSKFRAELSEELTWYSHRIHLFDDERIGPLLSNFHNLHTGQNYRVRENHESVDPADLDAYAKKHFPLCMKHMHEVLRSEHHHKHQGRLTYGLFLKAIGLLYEDALKFWRDEFTKKMDLNQFEKGYVYNIKHMYGLVGKRASYSPYSCVKIITSSVGPGEHHGCPFKHWDVNLVKQKVIECGVSVDGANEIKQLVSDGHYQLACGKYFEYTHGKALGNGINHPNQYFEESMNIEKGASGNKK
ncbi:DNA primase large subunit-like Protein [Tribolium castaneum]|uniref:DNA primase large subunit n=1 Tax=Tribolium castaneum TaxID=7070 RepID=D6WZI9_TRICA|nr:PREDICTED: DNA primase large subunit [Tribolium castaneum]EFA10435.1 DNA primase large subunit-like Protein [Tribolium castaneum]|eukprot:XP_971878.2 PREDICTED: DNA primase large subunit [Tribolium castaneum]